MEKYIEILKTIFGVLKFSFFPYSSKNLDFESYTPLKCLAKNERTKKKEITIISWNILRNYNKDLIHKHISKIIHTTNHDIILLQESPVYKNSSFIDSPLFQK